MRKNMPYMVLDITKKPGDPNAVKTGDMLLAENERLRNVSRERGDCAQLREALRKIKELFRDIDLTIDCPENEAYAIADAALAAPARNCDVGTVKEQIERFNEFCNSEWRDSGNANCGNCPLWDSGTIGHNCEIRWAQMPYEIEEGK